MKLDYNTVIPFLLVAAVALIALIKLSRVTRKGIEDKKKIKNMSGALESISRRYSVLAQYASENFFSRDGRIPVDADGNRIPFGVEVTFNSGHMRRHGVFTLNFDNDGRLNTTCPFVFFDEQAHERFHPGFVKDIRVIKKENKYL